MRTSRWMAAAIAAMAAGMPGLVLADSTLRLVIGGEGFDGPPSFSVALGDKPIGTGTIDSAIDTATAGRFADADNKSAYIKTFTFVIADADFRADAPVEIKLTNEAHGPAGSDQNRELYIRSVELNGRQVEAPALLMRSAAGVEPTAMLGDYLVVSQERVLAEAPAPTGGWPTASTAAAEGNGKMPAEPVTATVASTPTTPAVPAMTAPANSTSPVSAATKTAEAATAPVATSAAPVVPRERSAKVADAGPSKPDPAPPVPASPPAKTGSNAAPGAVSAQVASADTADSGNPAPEANLPECGLSKSFAIVGFNQNSNALTARVRRQLDRVAGTIGGQRCTVRLVGYSSTEGDYAHNALFAIERARKSLAYLSGRGVKFRHYSASGVGETTQFGPDPAANRRVTITVSP